MKHLALIALLPLTGCVVLAMVPYPVQIETTPAGATVRYVNQWGRELRCVSPCPLDLRDKFGFFSVYDIEAELAGYAKATWHYEEPSFAHAGVSPAPIVIKLEKQK